MFKKGILIYFNFSKPNGIKQKRVIKLGIRILVIIPKLGINKAKTPNDIILKTNRDKAICFRFKVINAPFIIKNSKKYQGMISSKTKSCR